MTDTQDPSSNARLERTIDALFDRFLSYETNPTTEFDADWPSDCEQGAHWVEPDGAQLVHWLPQARKAPYTDFQNLEEALEFPLHPDVKTHYGKYWSANLRGRAKDGDLTLLYLWNRTDVDRLIENLIGHAVACRNNKTPFSVFFAIAEPDSEYFLTINNTTGAIQLERAGHKPERTLAPNLAEFLDSIEPGWQGDSHSGV